jgi:predicted RecA/RadA family phage recombinase
MTNYVQEGVAIDYTVPAGGVTSGQLVLIGSIVGVCASTGVEDDVIAARIEGVFEVPKVAGAVTQGQALYFLGGSVTTADEGGSPWGDLVKAGVAVTAQDSGDATVHLKLNA